ncbi:MAG: DUF1385 domain-containing protein [Candidatus Bathyarchaeota archaeon]|nr:DUF1385 domain-containing protein [Candidatus Bathyarchaeota archaeon]
MEGVMMRSRKNMVMCVRKPSKEIVTNIEKVNPLSERHKILGLPFLRGVFAMVESLYLGFKSIIFSANTALEVVTPEGEDPWRFSYKELAVVVAGVLGITAVFMLVPFLLATWLDITGIVFNIIEAAIRLTMFTLYLLAISMWSEFKRILMYHGAEHKAINAHEAGVAMDVKTVRGYSRLHPRCGTSFLFIVLVISIVLYSIVPNLDFYSKLLYRIVLIPVIAGVSYELLRLSGKHKNSLITRVLVAPGLLFQRLTTREPTDDMLEVSIKALTEVSKSTRI